MSTPNSGLAKFDFCRTFQNITTGLVATTSFNLGLFSVFSNSVSLFPDFVLHIGYGIASEQQRKDKTYIFVYKWQNLCGHVSDVTECSNDIPSWLILVLFSD